MPSECSPEMFFRGCWMWSFGIPALYSSFTTTSCLHLSPQELGTCMCCGDHRIIVKISVIMESIPMCLPVVCSIFVLPSFEIQGSSFSVTLGKS